MTEAIWHDVECGSYAADLVLWEKLAAEADGPILDLGCGTGRVALHLARRGHAVTGLDADTVLLAALAERASGLSVEVYPADAREFALGRQFALALAPMQLLQLFANAEERAACLRCVAGHLRVGGLAAMAIVDRVPTDATDAQPPLPDVREIDGWVYSSLPVDSCVDGDRISIRRLRQTVAPDGALSDALDEIELRRLSAEALEVEAGRAGLKAVGRRHIPATDDHVGSTVVLMERRA